MAASHKAIVLESMDASSANLNELAAMHGCKLLAVRHGVKGAQSIDDIIIFSNWPENAIAENSGFLPVLDFGLANKLAQTIVPFKWAFEVIDKSSRANVNDDLLDLLHEFHLSMSWIIPVHGPHGNIGLVAIGNLEADLSARDVMEFQSASIELFDSRYRENQQFKLDQNRLSEVEVEILQLMVDGKGTDEIATIKNLSPFAIEAYATSAKLKLNSMTKVQAAAQAIRGGVIG